MSVSPFKTLLPTVAYGSIENGGSLSLADDRNLLGVSAPTDRVTVISNLLNALLGVGLFTIPWGFQMSGIVAGTVILCVVACGSAETVRILLISQQQLFQATGDIMGYSEMAAEAVGPVWGEVVKIATVISCMGGCCGYVIFFGQTLGQAFDLPADNVIYILAIPLVLLSWIRSFKELTVATVFGVAATMLTVIILIKDGSQYSHGPEPIPLALPHTMMHFAGSATFLFTIHYCALSIGEEWLKTGLRVRRASVVSCDETRAQEASNNDMFSELSSSIAMSYVAAGVLIYTVGYFGYTSYRDVDLVRDKYGDVVGGCEQPVCQNVILNISPGIFRNIVGIAMSLVIGLSYLVILAPAREHIEAQVLAWLQPSNDLKQALIEKVLRTSLVLLTVTVAIKAPYFGNVLGSVGGLTDAFLCFVLPPLIYRSLMEDQLSPLANAFYIGVTCVGVGIICYTLLSFL